MARIGLFEEQDARELLFLLHQLRGHQLGEPQQRRRRPLPGPIEIHIGKADASLNYTTPPVIPDDMGSVACDVWRFDDGAAEEEDTTENITAYDWLGSGVTDGDAVILFRCRHGTGARWYFIARPRTSFWAKASSSIGAGTSTKPTSGTVALQKLDGSGNYAALGVNVTAYNSNYEAVAANVPLQIKLNGTGQWMIDTEPCT